MENLIITEQENDYLKNQIEKISTNRRKNGLGNEQYVETMCGKLKHLL